MRHLTRGVVAALLLALPLSALARQAAYHISTTVVVPAEESAYSLKANATWSPAWPTASNVKVGSCVAINIDANRCEAKNSSPASTGWALLLEQPTFPFLWNTAAGGIDTVTDILVNSETANSNDTCTLRVECRVVAK